MNTAGTEGPPGPAQTSMQHREAMMVKTSPILSPSGSGDSSAVIDLTQIDIIDLDNEDDVIELVSDSEDDTDREDVSVAPQPTTQLPLPDFIAFVTDPGEVREKPAFKKIGRTGVVSRRGYAALRKSRDVTKGASQATSKDNKKLEAVTGEAEAREVANSTNSLPNTETFGLPVIGVLGSAIDGTIDAVAPRPGPAQVLLPLMGRDTDQAVVGTRRALHIKPSPVEVPLLPVFGDHFQPSVGGNDWLPGLFPLRQPSLVPEQGTGVPTIGYTAVAERQTGKSFLHTLSPMHIAPFPPYSALPPSAVSHDALHMFTDGSWLVDGSGGAGVAYKFNNIWYSRAIVLGEIIDHHVAELEGIRHAVRMAHALVPQVAASEVIIQTDSETSLLVLEHEKRGIRVPEMLENINNAIQADVAALPVPIRFWWVKAHVNNEGNERADKLARHGSQCSRRNVAAGWVFDNPIARDIDIEMKEHARLRREDSRDLVLTGATSAPEHSKWQSFAERRAELEEKRAEGRLFERMHGMRTGTSNEVRHAVKQLARLMQKRRDDGLSV